jgi:excisionase family DNA binding protein
MTPSSAEDSATATERPVDLTRPTISVEDAGRVLGISRGLAYQGVRDGSIPSLRVGRRILVPTARLLELLGERRAA